jgi:hypothetical protein
VILELSATDIAPDREAVLESLGIPPERAVPEHIEQLYVTATRRLEKTAAPIGTLSTVSRAEFETVYEGEGYNEPDSVVGDVFPRAPHLALFAVTLGAETSRAIAAGFESHDFALASMLDAVASDVADRAADVLERRYEAALREDGRLTGDGAALRYSPGYCGWHVSGQKRLFRSLEPERIGITLTDSCLMQPLKSVSGVIVAGPKEIHRISPNYSFCRHCETHSCRERLRALFGRQDSDQQGDPS